MPVFLSYPGSKCFIQGTCRWCKGGTCGYLERSEDGGQTWQRTDIPELDTYASCSSPWSYDQLPDGTVIRVFAVRRSAEEPYLKRVVAVLTRDGRTAQVVEVMLRYKDSQRDL